MASWISPSLGSDVTNGRSSLAFESVNKSHTIWFDINNGRELRATLAINMNNNSSAFSPNMLHGAGNKQRARWKWNSDFEPERGIYQKWYLHKKQFCCGALQHLWVCACRGERAFFIAEEYMNANEKWVMFIWRVVRFPLASSPFFPPMNKYSGKRWTL